MANAITTNTFAAATQIKSAEVNTNYDDLATMANAKCKVYLSGAQSVPNTAVTTLEFDTESYDPGSNFNTGTYTFTAPIAGYYYICLVIDMVMADQKNLVGQVNKNAGTVISRGSIGSSGAVDTTVICPTVSYLAATDTIIGQAYHNNGGANNALADAQKTYMDIHLLSV